MIGTYRKDICVIMGLSENKVLWGIDLLVIFELRSGLLQIWTQRRRSRMTLTEGQRGAQRFHPTGNVELFDIVWLYYIIWVNYNDSP
jgi:hypothetical protein